MRPSRSFRSTAPPATPLPRLSPEAKIVLRRRYLTKNNEGKVTETIRELFWRIATDIAEAEQLYPAKARLDGAARRFYELMARLEFLPNSPTLMNAGRPLQQLAACFVLPVEDSLDSILDAVKEQALIHQSGGGTGFSFSRLRPHNDLVSSTHGIASGPVSFMRIFNMTTDVIKQGGTRRGANMGILRIDHPDILEFIGLKQDPSEMTNFNLSVGLTADFMRALKRRQRYALINPRTGKAVRRLPARTVFDRLAQAAWATGEPGVIYLDRINAANPTPRLGEIEATNPCAEQPLLANESCTLGSIDVSKFVLRTDATPTVDYPRLAETIRLAVRFLDNVIDRNHYPLKDIEIATLRTRKIGLGIMGFADLLIALNLPYDTDSAIALARSLMSFVQARAHEASRDLALERGLFPAYRGSRLETRREPRRNATVTTIAPTGTISLIAGCSPGIEPLYGVRILRRALEGLELTMVNPAFVRIMRDRGLRLDGLEADLAASPSIQNIARIPQEIRRLFVTAHDVPPKQHVRMQAVFQRYSDSGVSKTINLPPSATEADVADAFLFAYELGCKGLTVFRSGSREAQVLSCSSVHPC
ncbi:MAG TPA: adenosylcobalamin-dependent ribonucleoside-diphosphate reductase [Nitrospira sp.]|nr:adenosylcobalamin-dependent ribonucleoside-diphosphate reductase [Nitrospira sp.]